jgi:hypothetical protein
MALLEGVLRWTCHHHPKTIGPAGDLNTAEEELVESFHALLSHIRFPQMSARELRQMRDLAVVPPQLLLDALLHQTDPMPTYEPTQPHGSAEV